MVFGALGIVIIKKRKGQNFIFGGDVKVNLVFKSRKTPNSWCVGVFLFSTHLYQAFKVDEHLPHV